MKDRKNQRTQGIYQLAQKTTLLPERMERTVTVGREMNEFNFGHFDVNIY